jgi:hypothetical protein
MVYFRLDSGVMNLGLFGAVKKLFRGLDEESFIRSATEVRPGPRGRKIYYLSTEEVIKTRKGYMTVRGFTSPRTGNIFIRPAGMNEETLRHETVHSLLVPRSRLGRYAMAPLHGSTYRYLEEALAEGYALRSLKRGLQYPIKYGYVSPFSIAADLGVKGYQAYLLYDAVSDTDDS